MPVRPHARASHERPTSAAVAVAAELLAEFGGAVCPSLAAALERLIDRQAISRSGGAR
ncbi:hypothetical protein [Roseicyclus sp.]|uniref:hypothetical protein n=1 Tax=Roseicyclus sp. TaxID=1914329 RepID=UPI003F6BE447